LYCQYGKTQKQKTMKIQFFANGIKATKTNLTEKQKANIDLTAYRFRQDMLAKHNRETDYFLKKFLTMSKLNIK
jgi:hypothetical protein